MNPSAPTSLPDARCAVNRHLDEKITSLESLRAQYQGPASLVVLDIEGCEGQASGITGVGVAIVNDPTLATPKSSVYAQDEALLPELDLANMVHADGIKAHNLACGARTGEKGRYERSPFARMHWIEKRYVNRGVDAILQATILHPKESSILVLWSGKSDLQAMVSTLPCFASRVSRWLDLSDIVGEMSGTSRRPHSLRDVMLSLGFQRADVQKLGGGHSAGMDAVRTMALLLALCRAHT